VADPFIRLALHGGFAISPADSVERLGQVTVKVNGFEREGVLAKQCVAVALRPPHSLEGRIDIEHFYRIDRV
jgi:hypothetical protein